MFGTPGMAAAKNCLRPIVELFGAESFGRFFKRVSSKTQRSKHQSFRGIIRRVMAEQAGKSFFYGGRL
jgi:hypothetical protein